MSTYALVKQLVVTRPHIYYIEWNTQFRWLGIKTGKSWEKKREWNFERYFAKFYPYLDQARAIHKCNSIWNTLAKRHLLYLLLSNQWHSPHPPPTKAQVEVQVRCHTFMPIHLLKRTIFHQFTEYRNFESGNTVTDLDHLHLHSKSFLQSSASTNTPES